MSLAGVSCLVTGAGGFLGRRIVCLLLEEDEALAEIRLLDKAFSREALWSFGKFQGKTEVKILEGDIRDVEFLHRACQGVSLVIHTASIIDTLGLVEKQLLWEVNVTGKRAKRLSQATACHNISIYSLKEKVNPHSSDPQTLCAVNGHCLPSVHTGTSAPR
ncbi:3 beta-hydroxysteroid dehydrogenase/Delta 5--_4-isomerase-like isoform X2 [Phasianus colchicus]|nr:3 beta-hydroxysteroid dehydrogenase/Delta 5-->4-isomerase-like isoform X2 [Phasianus colchicus]XP_031468954.1 3 beta-hydroxysteroid dehydrogenase/Delta 5-->4-isomerase-like isoform X2 [Phasianus colchicus]XP_031468955.1 3 beta-hydroxysteroid dehydrogenase/Delta 5-->4-isomerase-like isoform X2 [Phasianus colchicus]